ncbi:MAG: flagellar basal body protein, partial [Proteobacteria bacterium]|nr:flagellar basal body protein [Pseudomonadota bacterium]
MGLGTVLDIARSAMATQQYGIQVTGHNIANVGTEGYCRQNPVMAARQPSMVGGLIMGRGVDTEKVVRASDQFIENQLMQEKSGMASSMEMENYMQILEGMFNEKSESGVSA